MCVVNQIVKCEQEFVAATKPAHCLHRGENQLRADAI